MVKIRNHAGCNDCATAGEKVRQGSATLPVALALAVAGVGSRSPLAVRWLPLRERYRLGSSCLWSEPRGLFPRELCDPA